MKRKIKAMAVVLVMAIMMFVPQVAFAVSAPPPNPWYGTMQVEYRFAEDEPFRIPQQVSRFGYTYNLTSQSEPVLESEMPLTRTYSYRVEGVLDEKQLESIKDIPGLTITPVMVQAEQEIDKIEVVNKKTNDVDKIDQKKEFEVTVGFTDDGKPIKGPVVMNRTGVTFEVGPLDEDGLPLGYTATVIYRGVEMALIHGYYQVNESFTAARVSDVPVYVIVADYRTNEMPPPVATTLTPAAGGTGAGPGAGPGTTETAETVPEGLTTIEEEQVAQQAGAGPADIPGIVQDITDGIVPLGNAEVKGVWSFLSMIFCIAGIIIVGLSVITAAYQKKRWERLEDRPALVNSRGFLLRIITVVLAVNTVLTWVILDNFSYGMVWINENTLVVGILFIATTVLSIIVNAYTRRVYGQTEIEEEEDGITATAV